MPSFHLPTFPEVPRKLRGLIELLAWAVALFLLVRFIRGGTAPLRALYLLALFMGVIRPWWGLTAIAFLGPLSLLDPGKTHRLLQTDAFVIGSILGYLRTWRMAAAPPDDVRKSPAGDSGHGGIWSFWALALWIGMAASAFPAVWYLAAAPDFRPPGPFVWETLSWTLFGPATMPTWGLRSVFNWTTGILIAWVACKEATPEKAKSLLLFGALGTVAACVVGLASYVGFFSLEGWRADNPDLARMSAHRLMGLAGHSGWFAEWIVLTWPGLLLLFPGGPRRKALSALGLALVMTALLLTMARAGWLSAIVAGSLAVLFYGRRRLLQYKGYIGFLAAAGFVVVALGLLLAGSQLLPRLQNLLRFQDRWNYYISTYHLLAISPVGTGLGMHFMTYESLFTPFHVFWQYDHVTAHNTWLHVLVEQGPWQALLLGAGVAGVFVRGWSGYKRSSGETRRILFVLSLAFTGVMVESLAQFVGYIRVAEIMTWVLGGAMIGLTRLDRPVIGSPSAPATDPPIAAGFAPVSRRLSGARKVARLGWLLVGFSILMAAAAGGFQYRRLTSSPLPRPLEWDFDYAAFHLWTGKEWRFPVDPAWGGVEFTALAKTVPQDLVIEAPGNDPLHLHLEPRQRAILRFTWKPKKGGGAFRSLHWLKVTCSATWVPAKVEAGSVDVRRLGVYVERLRGLFRDGDPRRPESQWWRESDGPGISVVDEDATSR